MALDLLARRRGGLVRLVFYLFAAAYKGEVWAIGLLGLIGVGIVAYIAMSVAGDDSESYESATEAAGEES